MLTSDQLTLIESNYDLVQKMASNRWKTLPNHITHDDLVSWGTDGLIAAARNFKPEVNDDFRGYATKRIWGAMSDGLRAWNRGSRQGKQLQTVNYDLLENCIADEREFEILPPSITKMLKQLKPRDREMMFRYYWLNETQDALSKRYGLTYGRISQLHGQIIKRIRKGLNICATSFPT